MKFSKILTFITGVAFAYGRVCKVKVNDKANELSAAELSANELSDNDDTFGNEEATEIHFYVPGDDEFNTDAESFDVPTPVDDDDLQPTSTEAIEPTETSLELVPGPVTCTYKKKDTDDEYDIESDNQINCQGTTCDVKGDGIEVSEGIVTIKAAGNYILQGELEGQVRIEATENDFVHLILNNIHIESKEGPALVALSAEKVTITLVGDNNLLDSENYVNVGEKSPNSCLYAKTDVSINGIGNLNITGKFGTALHCTKDLRLVTGNVNVLDAKNKGIQAKNSICIHKANVYVNSYNSSLKVTNQKKADKGFIVIENGNVTVATKNDAIHAETYISIYDGYIDIRDCREGIEAQMIDILGGEIKISATNDAINASKVGDLKKPPMPGSAPRPSGIGGPVPTFEPMPFGPDGPGGPGGPGEPGPEASDGSVYINIVGGVINITCHARGGYDLDGIDSNGILYIGGNAQVNVDLELGKVYGDFAAIDSDGPNVISGNATVMAASTILTWEDAAKFMTEEEANNRPPPPPPSSLKRGTIYQPFIRLLEMEAQPDKTEIMLKDKNGKVIASYTPEYGYDNLLIISPKLVGGESYELIAGSFVTTVEASNPDEGSYKSPSVEYFN